MDRIDYEYLKKATLDPLDPKFTEDMMFRIGWIFEAEDILTTASDALEFCERPDKWIVDLKNLITEYEVDLLQKDCDALSSDEKEIAYRWLLMFDYNYKALEELFET